MDANEARLFLAKKRDNITYAKMSATPDSTEDLERIVGPNGSMDLVIVATALNWFDHAKFYPIVKRMLRKPGGVVATWSFPKKLMKISPEFDATVDRSGKMVTPYKTYKTEVLHFLDELSFPFDPVPGVEVGKGVQGSPMEIPVETRKSFDDVMFYLRSFLPMQMALDNGVDLLDKDAREALSKAWGPKRVCTVNMKIRILLGTVVR